MKIILFGVLTFIVSGVAMADIASTTYASSADNITHGTLSAEHLPIGDVADTVASGDDVRFETVSIGRPDTDAPSDRALIWIE